MRDLLATYWLEPIRINEAMGWRSWGSNYAPTLRRVRCLTRYVLAPLFHSEVEEEKGKEQEIRGKTDIDWPPNQLAPSDATRQQPSEPTL